MNIRHCEARSAEAIQSAGVIVPLDCFAALAMTRTSLTVSG
jgi:hypothetical protein